MQKDKKVLSILVSNSISILTNYCLYIISRDSGNSNSTKGYCLNLPKISSIQDCSKLFSRSTRINIRYNNINNNTNINILILIIISLHLSQQDIGLKFENYDIKEEFLLIINNALLKRSWEKATLSTSLSSSMSTISIDNNTTIFQKSAKNLGVGGIILKQERELQSVQRLSKDAVQDMESLMRQAKDVVTMVQRYAGYMAEQSSSTSLSDGTVSEYGEINEMNEILQEIGIVSPVTRYTAGKLYHQELARQIADILLRENRLKRMGGMITLPDCYCLLNKARGTEPVSPDDFYNASQIVGSLRVGIKLKSFDTGVLVLQLDNMTDDYICLSVMNMYNTMVEIKEQGLHTALVARYHNLSIVVAKQHLLLAESLGYLCRDESSQGTFFFPNKFT